MWTRAIVRRPGENLARGLTTQRSGPPAYGRALEQHAAYCHALRGCGLEVTVLEADARHPDGCFVEDTAVVLDEAAILTRPGDPSRRGEVAAVAEVLGRYRPLLRIRSPGRLDGGDVLRVGDHVYIGRSGRTNAEGARQLMAMLSAHGYTASEVPVDAGLHLKSGVTWLGDDTLIATGELAGSFPRWNVLPVRDDEAYAANCLHVNGRILIPAGFPGARRQVRGLGMEIVEVEMSEFRKLDGGLTCLSLLL